MWLAVWMFFVEWHHWKECWSQFWWGSFGGWGLGVPIFLARPSPLPVLVDSRVNVQPLSEVAQRSNCHQQCMPLDQVVDKHNCWPFLVLIKNGKAADWGEGVVRVTAN